MTDARSPQDRSIHADCSPAALAALVEENNVAYWRACAPRLAGGAFHEDGDLTWFTTSFSSAPWFNQVLLTRFPHDVADARIDETLAIFSGLRRPMLWSVSASDSPADLEARLQERGLDRAGGVLTGMALALHDLPEGDPPQGLAIERVRDETGLRRWLQAYIAGFGMSEEAARPFFDLYRDIGFDESAPFRHYTGALAGEPVASSTVFLDAGARPEQGRRVASIWHVGTVPNARRRGIGAAMTLAPLHDARGLGFRAGVLGSSEAGLRVYEKLGFQAYGRIVQYKWTPES